MNTPSWRHLMPGAHNAPPPLLFCRPLWSAQINRDQRLVMGQLPRPNRIEIVNLEYVDGPRAPIFQPNVSLQSTPRSSTTQMFETRFFTSGLGEFSFSIVQNNGFKKQFLWTFHVSSFFLLFSFEYYYSLDQTWWVLWVKIRKERGSALKKLYNKTVKYVSFELMEEIRRQFGNVENLFPMQWSRM